VTAVNGEINKAIIDCCPLVSHFEYIYTLLAWPLPERLRANMTLSTEPEVYNVLYCYQRRTEPRPQLTHFVRFGHVEEMCRSMDIQTDIQTLSIHHTSTGDRASADIG